ncbi:MAG: transposase [Chloroflexi bacterium]|nr:transposase [Chloroflexota bacterium]
MESVFADTKTKHVLGRAKYRGLRKLTAQALLSATAYNLKKLLRHQRMAAGGHAMVLPVTVPQAVLALALGRRWCYSLS